MRCNISGLADDFDTPKNNVLRFPIPYKGFKLELDHVISQFLEFAEIECETEKPDEYKKVMLELLKAHNIKWDYSEHGKRSRVLKAW